MLQLSSSEKKSATDRQLRQVLSAVSLLASKSAELECRLESIINSEEDLTETSYQEIIAQILALTDAVAEINERGRVYGADIYIQADEPAQAQENDCWLDLSMLGD